MNLCSQPAVQNITYLVGIVVLGIKIAVPIVLIIVGMTDLLQAIGKDDKDAIKTAQSALVKKAIAAVVVFLITTIVGLLMGVIGGKDYEGCMECVNGPFSKSCNAPLKSSSSLE